jgi:hypothetical protein
MHLFIDSEFENEKYISLQGHLVYYLDGKLNFKSFIIFNEEYKSFCEKEFGLFQKVKNEEVEIFYEVFDEVNTVLTNVLVKVLQFTNFFFLI